VAGTGLEFDEREAFEDEDDVKEEELGALAAEAAD
jgi:hypothetical protein